jgi:hypothetical protein
MHVDSILSKGASHTFFEFKFKMIYYSSVNKDSSDSSWRARNSTSYSGDLN